MTTKLTPPEERARWLEQKFDNDESAMFVPTVTDEIRSAVGEALALFIEESRTIFSIAISEKWHCLHHTKGGLCLACADKLVRERLNEVAPLRELKV